MTYFKVPWMWISKIWKKLIWFLMQKYFYLLFFTVLSVIHHNVTLKNWGEKRALEWPLFKYFNNGMWELDDVSVNLSNDVFYQLMSASVSHFFFNYYVFFFLSSGVINSSNWIEVTQESSTAEENIETSPPHHSFAKKDSMQKHTFSLSFFQIVICGKKKLQS